MINDPQHPSGSASPVPPMPQHQNPSPTHNLGTMPPPGKKQRRFHIWPRKWSIKKKRIATGILAVVLVLLASGAFWFYWSHRSKPVEQQAAQEQAPPPPTTEASNLTGEQVPIGTNQRTVVGVMIENSPDARPQSGLNTAGVVYEAVAEGGITRFLALYQENQPDYVGPVRSARPYFVEWVKPFNAGYAHVGGSPEALALIKALNVKDLDQFYNTGPYQRVNQRYAPHNVYTTIPALEKLINEKGYAGSNYTSFVRKPTSALVTPPTARVIDFNISSALYNPRYEYDPASNTYKRSMAGKPHTDERSGAQLSPKAVIALVMPSSIAADRVHTVYNTTGGGQMFLFQDGGVTQGTWSKPNADAQFAFTDANGQPLALTPGQAWISMVKDAASVAYIP